MSKYSHYAPIAGIIGYIVNLHDPLNYDIDLCGLDETLKQRYSSIIRNTYTYKDEDGQVQTGTTYRCRLKGIGIQQPKPIWYDKRNRRGTRGSGPRHQGSRFPPDPHEGGPRTYPTISRFHSPNHPPSIVSRDPCGRSDSQVLSTIASVHTELVDPAATKLVDGAADLDSPKDELIEATSMAPDPELTAADTDDVPSSINRPAMDSSNPLTTNPVISQTSPDTTASSLPSENKPAESKLIPPIKSTAAGKSHFIKPFRLNKFNKFKKIDHLIKEAHIAMIRQIDRQGGWVFCTISDCDVYNRILISLYDPITGMDLSSILLSEPYNKIFRPYNYIAPTGDHSSASHEPSVERPVPSNRSTNLRSAGSELGLTVGSQNRTDHRSIRMSMSPPSFSILAEEFDPNKPVLEAP